VIAGVPQWRTLTQLSTDSWMEQNNLRRIRESKMLSKAELARLAGISPLTIDRIEKGMSCRLATKRKILQALGVKLAHKNRVFTQ
jgi:DNA-binding XRE family transcriptional regulator